MMQKSSISVMNGTHPIVGIPFTSSKNVPSAPHDGGCGALAPGWRSPNASMAGTWFLGPLSGLRTMGPAVVLWDTPRNDTPSMAFSGYTPHRGDTFRPLLVMLIFFSFFVSPAGFGWSFHTHRKITSDALNRMPAWFQIRFMSLKEILLKGSTDPDSLLKDFQNHVYHVQGRMTESAGYIRELCESISGKIINHQADADIARSLGLLSHYVADINQPLHTAGAESDPHEDDYHMKFEKDVEGRLSKIEVLPVNYGPVTNPVQRIVSMAEAANISYFDIGKAYRTGNRLFDLLPIVDKQYNAAVKNVCDFWLGAFVQAKEKIDLIPPTTLLSTDPAPPFGPTSQNVHLGFQSPDKIIRVNINSAPPDQLMTLPGIGEKKAKTIIEARPFKSIYDLAKLKGFGPKLVERLSDRITVE